MNTHMKLLSTALFSVALMGAMPASADNHGDEHMKTHEGAVNQGQEGEDKTIETLPTQRSQGDEVEAGTVGSDEMGSANKRPDSTVDGPDGVNGGGATAE
ncbi:MAG TPA: hypothetical protein ENH72_04750 [Pseudomonas sabulinigri]|uniref:Uncharacterized protein n=1 Tax=marine sediment metagenome TaxID=412755 RepID=A0A0F9XZW3_9ZZZZ|nr:hypothetical protein [Halopseudomonas sabulinigri]HEC51081.1 hypothetical protein [Halopseudomonas sabulinigri]|tara:strand:+ start:5421 stop:5720 length:300 start_codon:yes stop_codon:yes gene_type:complete